MSGRADLLREEFAYAFDSLEKSLEELDDGEYYYRLTEASNSIQAILYHLSLFTKLNIPSIIRGEAYSTPEVEMRDQSDVEYCFDKLWGDIVAGKEAILDGVGGLSDGDLDEVVPLMSGPYPRKVGLYAYLGEIIHHRGQIAFIRGSIRRLRERDPEFLR